MSQNNRGDDAVFQFKNTGTSRSSGGRSSGGHSAKNNKKKKPFTQRKPYRFFATLFIVICCVALSLFIAYFGLTSASDLLGINQKDQQIEVEIPQSAEGSITKVAKILDDAGIIDQRLTFELYAKFRHMDGSDRGEGKAPRKFLAGTYVLNSRWGYDQLNNHLSIKSENTDIVTVTLSEGMTAAQIAKKLEESGVCKSSDFFNALSAEYDYAFLEKIPEDNRFRRLEGYLFPDTYEFFTDMNAKEVVRKFLSNYQNRMDDDLLHQMQNLPNGLGELDNLMTLASIIQKEAGSYEEMCRVSAVFHNRLDNSAEYPHLQSDATAIYIKENIRPYVDVEDQELYDAYDSTVAEGLPIGPICNPGLDAIKAAINPDPTITGYFFVSDNANTYYYADTYAQHQQNIATAKAVNKQLKEAE